ncbi:hypothetical protein SAMN04487859_11746 [Roseovarius lutimaris]|uniref:Flagellar FliJ protein n=1 Tax=Roseovarius lutimaris TaxID=1005928 RepID=A0A1I5ETS4_9RHOB|nr:hypothetical protein [Roseovarius lutimaris]SFO14928.1 hypothetical protein SAMN04487859_11746 [Roseovarius lutimaris]
MSQRLSDLTKLTEALYQAETAKMQDLLLQEAKLRQDLADLEEHRRANRDLPYTAMQGVRQIGADILWQGWVGRSKVDLQAELARVLARKGQMIGQLRRAFGKHQAATKMLADDTGAHTKKALVRRESLLADLALLKQIGNR